MNLRPLQFLNSPLPKKSHLVLLYHKAKPGMDWSPRQTLTLILMQLSWITNCVRKKTQTKPRCGFSCSSTSGRKFSSFHYSRLLWKGKTSTVSCALFLNTFRLLHSGVKLQGRKCCKSSFPHAFWHVRCIWLGGEGSLHCWRQNRGSSPRAKARAPNCLHCRDAQKAFKKQQQTIKKNHLNSSLPHFVNLLVATQSF